MTQSYLVERDATWLKAWWNAGLGRIWGGARDNRCLVWAMSAVLAVLLLCPSLAGAGAGHVVLVVIDGPRHTEFLDEPGQPHAQVLGTVLGPSGAHVPDFQNQNQTVTMVGHGTLVTGTEQPLANDGTERPNRPTLFELARKELGLPQSAVRVVAGKEKIGAVSYSTHPDYGAAFGAMVDVATRQDPETYVAAVSAITANPRPVLTVINFASVDYAGHSGVWEDYLAALVQADSLVGELWNVIQADSVLAGDTDLFITADHGRHDDAHGGFANHGDDCMGCRTLPFVALGPDIRAGVVSGRPRTQEDVAPTIAKILGLTAPPMEGWVMEEILVGGQIGVGEVLPAPSRLRAWPNPSRGVVNVGGVLPGSDNRRDSGELRGVGERRGSGELRGVGELRGSGETAASTVDVLRVDGRRVLSSRPVTSWPWRWDGRDDAGRALPAGIYWIRVRSPEGASDSVKTTLVR